MSVYFFTTKVLIASYETHECLLFALNGLRVQKLDDQAFMAGMGIFQQKPVILFGTESFQKQLLSSLI